MGVINTGNKNGQTISFLLYFITKKVKGAGTILTGATAYDYFKG
jgi:hypothetical protein|tara:strand:+ start:175 stop:306 length:132 start_codon:yes stop_codon:yes gene_type:complete